MHLIKVYAIAGLLTGVAAWWTVARAQVAQSSMGMNYELMPSRLRHRRSPSPAASPDRRNRDRHPISGVMTSGFITRVDAFYQGYRRVIIVAAVAVDAGVAGSER
jgi:inositol transport system permease protein